MSTNAITTTDDSAAIMERVLIAGDLKNLSPDERVRYYGAVCQSVGLNPLTKPFEYITLNGKLTLYALKGATDQLRDTRGISIIELKEHNTGDLFIVWATARDAHGRIDKDMGAASIKGLQGDALVNAMLKAITKAKRRVTLSLAGLGWLDETEVASIPSAQAAPEYSDEIDRRQYSVTEVVTEDGEIIAADTPLFFDTDGRMLDLSLSRDPAEDVPLLKALLDAATSNRRYAQASAFVTASGYHTEPELAAILAERDRRMEARKRATA